MVRMKISSIASLVDELRPTLARVDPVRGGAEALRLIADWYTSARLAHTSDPLALVTTEPSSLDDSRWDALIAGVVEQLALIRGFACPRWVFAESRYVSTWWFVSPFASVHPSAFVETPAGLANHGVFLHADDLASL
jgi:hypothetical protein